MAMGDSKEDQKEDHKNVYGGGGLEKEEPKDHRSDYEEGRA